MSVPAESNLERRFAQEARLLPAGRLLYAPDRLTSGDQLANLIVEHHDLRDRLAPAEAAPTAVAATASRAQIPVAHLLQCKT